MRPVIITQRIARDPEHDERRDCLDQRWATFLETCGLAGVPAPNSASLAVGIAAAVQASGIVLSGGGDLVKYGGDGPERDATERALITWARERHLPVLGVCRGMQAIQDLFGVGLSEVAGHVATRHPVSGEDRNATVNSFHRLGTGASAPELAVWAVAADGIVEAVRHRSEPIIGIMWHPERESPYSAEDIALVRRHFGGEA